MGAPVYKILSKSAFEAALAKGSFEGSPVDTRDGFIHLSAGAQIAGTLAAHFAGQDDLLLVAIDSNAVGTSLKWEPSRGGELFPHLYAPLDLAHVLFVEAIPIGADGRHLLPSRVAP